MLAGTKQGQALVDASSELERLGLIARKDKVGQWLEVSRNGQEFADDVIPIWEQICSKRLKPEQEELLRGINESMTQNRIEQVLTRLTSPLVEVKYKIINYRLGPVGQIEVLRAKHGINSRQT